jgi:methionyl-tRNA formyltransferase
LRVVFAGTPPFAARSLEALLEAGHQVPLVLTQPDRPAGRGLKLTGSAVDECARRHGIEVSKPASLRGGDSADMLSRVAPDVMVVAAYGLLLPPDILSIPRRGCVNIHASLLPRWRGAAPIQRAILAGDAATGVSIMQMDAGLDTGPVLLAKSLAIDARATSGTLTEALADLGAAAIVDTIGRLDGLPAVPQDSARATHAPKVSREEAQIDWRRANDEIDRQVRAFNPVPGAESRLGGDLLKIWEARPVDGRGEPGCLLDFSGALIVACGRGALRIERLQRPGARRLETREFLRGYALPAEARFGDSK